MSEMEQLTSAVPVPEEDLELKPERVAEGLALQPAALSCQDTEAPLVSVLKALTPEQILARLKAERVQERLKKMPGWGLVHDGHAIERVRELTSWAMAAEYAGIVLREAGRWKQKVRVGLEGTRAVITVLAPSGGRLRGVVGGKQLDFAEFLP